MLPFEFLDDFIRVDKDFTSENKEELKQAIEFGKIIKGLIESGEILFKQAYFKEGFIFIQNDDVKSVF
ncbi:hypothetical protein PDN39_21425 [Bacillus cereus]|nr:hypothetical protein [Bacillus cereus]